MHLRLGNTLASPPGTPILVGKPLIMTIDSSLSVGSGPNHYNLPFGLDFAYDCFIEWGDGSTDTITAYNDAAVIHDYGVGAQFQIKIHGSFEGFDHVGADDEKILSVDQWGTNKWLSMESAFRDCANLTTVTTDDAPDLSLCT